MKIKREKQKTDEKEK